MGRSYWIHKNNGLILKLQQRFRGDKHNVFTEEVNKIVLFAKNIKVYNQSVQLKDMHMERSEI